MEIIGIIWKVYELSKSEKEIIWQQEQTPHQKHGENLIAVTGMEFSRKRSSSKNKGQINCRMEQKNGRKFDLVYFVQFKEHPILKNKLCNTWSQFVFFFYIKKCIRNLIQFFFKYISFPLKKKKFVASSDFPDFINKISFMLIHIPEVS